MGLEQTPEKYVANMVEVFREVKRVLCKDGTLWLNMGDCYAKEGLSGMGDPTVGKRNLGGMKPIKKKIPHGLKPKDLVGMPWRVAFALQADGWWLRSDIIWSKPNPMPESVTDRPTKAHEYIFLLSKSSRYFYDAEAIKEPTVYSGVCNGVGFGHGTDKEIRARDRIRGSKGVINNPLNSDLRTKVPAGWDIKPGVHGSIHREGRAKSGNIERKINAPGRLNTHMGSSIPWEGNTRSKRTVWNIATKPYSEAHFATFPPEIPEICLKAGCPEGGTALDPFAGSGTTLWVAEQLGLNSIGIELKSEYCQLIKNRMANIEPSLFEGVHL
jgi:DNA modification methylase